MKITVGQLKKLIKEQVEEAKNANALEKFNKSLETGVDDRSHPIAAAAIAAVKQGKPAAKVVEAIIQATSYDDGRGGDNDLMHILALIARSDKKVEQELRAASKAYDDDRY